MHTVKSLSLGIIALALLGCAQGHIDVLDKEGKVVGYCSADFKFHWHGAEHSVNYLLYLCAKEHAANGYKLSDPSILERDYSLPPSPAGKKWSVKLAKQQFSRNKISEEELGYLLAALEYDYWKKLEQAKQLLSKAEISKHEYDLLIKQAKEAFKGE